MIKKTIFILGTIICILFLIGRPSLAQNFNVVVDNAQYPNANPGNTVPLNPNQAVLYMRLEPRGGTVVDANILPNFTFQQGMGTGFGWAYNEGTSGVDGFSETYVVIDASNMYVKSTGFPISRLNAIQNILVSKNLGTVAQRQFLIRSFRGFVYPPDFRSMLSGWIWAGIALFIALPMLWILKKFLRS